MASFVSVNSGIGENRWNVNGKLLCLTQYCFTALVQRISTCDEIQNAILTPDKLMNIFMYWSPVWGRGTPFPPCPFTSSSFPLLLFYFFHWLYLFSSFVHTFPFYQIVPLRFQARGRRKWPNLGLVRCVYLCYLYSLVKVDSGVLFCLV